MIQTNLDVADINAFQNAPASENEVPSMNAEREEDTDEDDDDDEDLDDEDMDDDDDATDDDTDYVTLPSNESGLTTNNDSIGDTSEEA